MERTNIKVRRNKRLVIALVVVIVLLLAGLYWQNFQTQSNQKSSGDENQRAIIVRDKVDKLINIPKDEIPTLVAVTNEGELNNQLFFKDAKKGDLILVFPKAKMAVIYRESENKIINAGEAKITNPATLQ